MGILEWLDHYNLDVQQEGVLYKLLCPFHSENTPSFIAYPETNSFYCYGCHVGGGIVEFISLYEGISKKQVRARLQSVSDLKHRLHALEGKKETDYTKETNLLIANVVYSYLQQHPSQLNNTLKILQAVDARLVDNQFSFREGLKLVEKVKEKLNGT